MSESSGDNVLRLRGLPWQATREDVVSFFSDCKIRKGANGVFMTLSAQGRPSGEAYVEMESEDDVTKGLEKHKKNMGNRYIEVFTSNRKEMDWATRRTGPNKTDMDPALDGFVRLRGLPFDCNEDDVRQFFEGLSVVRDGIVLPIDHQGRSSGEAYIQFTTREIADKAMGKHKEKIGHRYIEIFKSSAHEFLAIRNQQQGYMDRSHGGSRIGGGYGSSDTNYRSFDSPYPPSKRNYYPPSNRSTPYDRNYNKRYQSGGGNWGSGSSRPPLSQLGFRRPYYAPAIMDDSDREIYREKITRHDPDLDSSYWDKYNMIHMRGLPYKATEEDIEKFFSPYVPISIGILFDNLGRPSGEADVEFATHEEANMAMSKNKSNMELRYIELFLRSRSESDQGDIPDHPTTSTQRYSTHQGHHQPSYGSNNYSREGGGRGGRGYNSGPRGNHQMGMRNFLSERTK
ncbi:heterogeneous nuclear ribonucleoprotein F-like isoform X1 [Panonychus citri]|uniref:heterogeneous nuclear ribonucleoprotein F-like isoform X1 n=1 Tax=Panonychus citri TaxID=50023 RepID=UPI002307AA0E|nr:heterogeneous nuclear ribonucleoprotein F-like isoform X1 [Panonychus citri]